MPTEILEFILNRLSSRWSFEKNIEITLETNPSTIETNNFDNLSKIGVNRLSLGFQSINDKTLEFLGRTHSAAESVKGLEIAKKYFRRVSLDLIYGTPGQTEKTWEKELKQITNYAGEHISAYQLSIEKGTKFFSYFNKGLFSLPSEKKLLNLYHLTDDILSDYGYNKYEISNYSKLHGESIHNMKVWKGYEYIGLGPGAHGRIIKNNNWYNNYRFPSPVRWLDKALVKKNSLLINKKINSSDRAKEIFLTSLRLIKGVNLTELKDLSKIKSLKSVYNKKAVKTLSQLGLLKFDKKSIKLTQKGFPVINAILEKILY